jgi:phosphotransferase system enzyme I (PtsI)
MIEVPAAALSVTQFVEKLKFLSIGTNDLIQYTLAIDRSDSSVAHLYDHLHPAVLHLVANTIKGGVRAGVPVAVCGELAGELDMTELLLGMGLRQFSMHPSQILPVKEQLFELSSKDAVRLAGRVLREWDPVKIRAVLDGRREGSLGATVRSVA